PGGWGDEAHHAEEQQLAAGGRLLTELLHRLLELVGAPLGLGERRLHHLAKRGTLLRVDAGESLVEVFPRRSGVVALGGAGAEQGARGGAVLRLRQQLLVGARLELR